MDRILRVEESNNNCVPRHLELLVERMGKDRLFHDVKPGDEGFLPVECELIFALAVVIALEEGFRMDDTWNTIGYDRRVFDSLAKMSNFRTKSGTLSVELRLPLSTGFKFHVSTSIILNNCTLVTVISEDPKGKCFSSSAAIENNKYLKTSEKGAAIFEKITELCTIVKKPIYLAKLNAWRSLNQVFPDIFCLPEDVKRFLFKKLRASDFVKLCSSSSKISQYLNEDDIWRHFLKRDFKCEPAMNKTAKATYQSKMMNRPMIRLNANSSPTPVFARIEEQYRNSSEYSFDLPPYPEQFS